MKKWMPRVAVVVFVAFSSANAVWPQVTGEAVLVWSLPGPIFFEANSSQLSTDGKEALKVWAWRYAIENRAVRLVLTGHADLDAAGAVYNEALARRRARSARHYLEHVGLAADQLIVEGKVDVIKECLPGDANCRRKARRVDIHPEIHGVAVLTPVPVGHLVRSHLVIRIESDSQVLRAHFEIKAVDREHTTFTVTRAIRPDSPGVVAQPGGIDVEDVAELLGLKEGSYRILISAADGSYFWPQLGVVDVQSGDLLQLRTPGGCVEFDRENDGIRPCDRRN
ncbi:MAG: OmpA family protein [Thermoanaerobaculia bacterium]